MFPPVSRRLVAAALAMLAGLSVSACERQATGETRIVVIGDGLTTADPAMGPLTHAQSVLLANVAQGLVRFDARGQIEPGLAERWNVTDDGLSYIFRLASDEWPDGRKITAHQVARILRRQVGSRSKNELKDTLGAIDEIVAMTDRVLEIRLKSPRPNLLQLLAQPELGIARDGQGTGPFSISADSELPEFRLERSVAGPEGEEARREEAYLSAAEARRAVNGFRREEVDLVLGGTFADLPYARAVDLPRGALQFDPAMGLFGLVPASATGPAADAEVRRLLSQALDRQALVDALNVPGLLPRATVLEPGLDGLADPAAPAWIEAPMEQRRPPLIAAAARQFGEMDRPTIRVALPDAPGARLLLNRLANDWGALGIKVEAAGDDDAADFVLLDLVAPSTSPAWFLRQFRCGRVPVCDAEADELMDKARATQSTAERNGLLAQAAGAVDSQQLFLPLAAPIRWSLVSDRVQGFATNRFARHTLTGLSERLTRVRAE